MKRILITAGEPAGIGPDLAVSLAKYSFPNELIVVADRELIRQRAEMLNSSTELVDVNLTRPPTESVYGKLKILHIPAKQVCHPRELNSRNSQYVLETIKVAVNLCLEKQAHALVTCPVHKGIINDAGIHFTGHTEYLAELTSVAQPVMMLLSEHLRIAFVTTHLPLSKVTKYITPDRLAAVVNVLNHDLIHKFKIQSPCILVTGLNPHAGEDGHLGNEEITVISPVLEKLRIEGLNLIGPLSADSVFQKKYLDVADAILVMYHDQGLPVIKYDGFGHTVNITLGLPMIRTSVDHGTAIELAGQNIAHNGSLLKAIELADSLAGD